MKKIFIDGSAGTTGLRIVDRLSGMSEIELITLTEENRKDISARKDAINSADVAFFCLPDDAAKEAASLVENPDTIIIDTSTAHRTNDDWTYGFPEIGNQKEKIKVSKKIANPGCYASGFISLVAPLVEKGILNPDADITSYGISGYSGGGKKMIAQYEADEVDPLLSAPRIYGLTLKHKHIPEMKKVSGLSKSPIFTPIVCPYYSGMEVSVPLFAKDINGSLEDIKALYADYYNGGLVKFLEAPDEGSFLSAAVLSGSDVMRVSAFGNDDQILLVSRFDNLGKGASGAAIQNMNIALGYDETYGLNIGGLEL